MSYFNKEANLWLNTAFAILHLKFSIDDKDALQKPIYQYFSRYPEISWWQAKEEDLLINRRPGRNNKSKWTLFVLIKRDMKFCNCSFSMGFNLDSSPPFHVLSRSGRMGVTVGSIVSKVRESQKRSGPRHHFTLALHSIDLPLRGSMSGLGKIYFRR